MQSARASLPPVPSPGQPGPDLPPTELPSPGPDLPPTLPELPPTGPDLPMEIPGLPGNQPDLPPTMSDAGADVPLAARRALDEAEARRAVRTPLHLPVEHGGRRGPEPVRYGDWEKGGLAIDF